jgi:hypothetical protein
MRRRATMPTQPRHVLRTLIDAQSYPLSYSPDQISKTPDVAHDSRPLFGPPGASSSGSPPCESGLGPEPIRVRWPEDNRALTHSAPEP